MNIKTIKLSLRNSWSCQSQEPKPYSIHAQSISLRAPSLSQILPMGHKPAQQEEAHAENLVCPVVMVSPFKTIIILVKNSKPVILILLPENYKTKNLPASSYGEKQVNWAMNSCMTSHVIVIEHVFLLLVVMALQLLTITWKARFC